MAKNNQYGPEAYKRLELVRKHFQNTTAQQNKSKTIEHRPGFLNTLGQNKVMIGRLTVYVIMAAIAISIIITAVSK